MQTILVVIHLFLALGLVGLILIQHGKGADAGAAFGSGASATVFGAQGSASFLTRTTALLAALFFITSMVMAYFATQTRETTGVMDAVQVVPEAEVERTEIPAVPVVDSDLPVIPSVQEESEVPVPATEKTD